MVEHDEQDFEQAASGASYSYPMQAGAIKKNAFCMLKGKPCRVVEYTTSKTGKHGHAKAHIIGLDLFTGKKYEDMCPTSHNVDVPIVKRVEFQLIGIDDGFCTLLDDCGERKVDLRLPTDTDGNLDEVGKKVQELFTAGVSVSVLVLSTCGHEKIIGHKILEQQ